MIQRFRSTQVLFIGIDQSAARDIWEPAADVFQADEGWVVKLELPGIRHEDVTVAVLGRRLIIAGQRRDCPCAEHATHLRMEIAYGPFERSIELPEELHRAQIRTEYLDGMLIIRVRTGA